MSSALGECAAWGPIRASKAARVYYAGRWTELAGQPSHRGGLAEFSYGHHSSQVYGFAHEALKRRMAAIGIEIPPPEELMPVRVDFSGLAERRSLPRKSPPVK